MLESCSCARFYHAETAECKALQDKHLRTFVYLDTTGKTGPQADEESAKSQPTSMCVALDIDGTITRHPQFFAFLSKALIDSGHAVYIISFRGGQEEVEADLASLGISFTEVVLPTSEDIGREGFYGWKASVCRRLGIEVFFEDMPEVINALDRNVLALVPFDAELGPK